MASLLQTALGAIIERCAPRSDGQAREARIMAAVLLECALNSCTKAKMGDIAARARVSTATLYRDYKDREALFCRALELGLTLLAQVWRPQTLPNDPLKRLEALLAAHARSWSDPFLGWLIRMYIQYSSTHAPYLLELGRAARASNYAFWEHELEALVTSGNLTSGHTQTIMALVLGAIERRTVFARLGFGEGDQHGPALDQVVEHTAYAVFQVFGTKAFWDKRTDARAPGWCGDGRPAFSKTGASDISTKLDFWTTHSPKQILDLPSARLSKYANRLLQQDHDRLDAQGRKARIQLATMLECIDNGFEAVGMAEIAARAHVSTATLYHDYKDKDDLLLDAILLQSRFRMNFIDLIDEDVRFQDAITDLNYSLACVLADPKFLWFHYASMASALSQSPELVQSSQATRAHTEGLWFDYFDGLVEAGHLPPFDMPIMLNLLLGITQRRSVQAMVLFGPEDTDRDELAKLSRVATEFVFRLLGPTSAMKLEQIGATL